MALMGSEQLGSLVGVIKEKLLQKLKQKQKQKKKQKPYARMEKSASLRTEIKSMQARRLIDRTLKAADRPGKVSLPS